MTTRISRHQLWTLWKWLCVGVLLCLVIPMRYTCLKVGLLAGGVALWALTVALFWGKPWIRAACVLMAVLTSGTLMFLMLPGRAYDPRFLRREYVRMLLSYRGTPYVWGGGNHLGIDCSGLVQRGLIDADFVQAAATGNPRLARLGLSLWWHNRSARALGQGYRGDTRFVQRMPSLNGASDAPLQPGDLAVLSDGVHVLAYIGADTWIEADPRPMRVILAHSPRRTDAYFDSPVRIMRWRALE